MKNDFDSVAFFYDLLTRAFFGKEWEHAQLAPAKNLIAKQNILIVGGGTGKILEGLNSSLTVDFVELSDKMLTKASRRHSQATIHFHPMNFLDWESATTYDAVYFPFFLDCFKTDTLDQVILKSWKLLNTEGELHVLDFKESSFFKNLLIKLMYLFFKLTAGLEGGRLLDFDEQIKQAGFAFVESKTFQKGWVGYTVYRK